MVYCLISVAYSEYPLNETFTLIFMIICIFIIKNLINFMISLMKTIIYI